MIDYNQIIDGVYGVLGVIGTGIIGFGTKTAVRFLKSKHLDLIAAKAVGFVADYYRTIPGQAKLKKACEYVSNEIDRIPGFKRVTENEVEQVVRAAYQKIYGVAVATEQEAPTVRVNVNTVKADAKATAKEIGEKLKSAALDTAAKVATTAIEGELNVGDAGTLSAKDLEALKVEDATKAPETAQDAPKAAEATNTPETTKESVKPEETNPKQTINITPTAKVGELTAKDLETMIKTLIGNAFEDLKKL